MSAKKLSTLFSSFKFQEHKTVYLKELHVIESRAFSNIGYSLVIAKTTLKIHFVQYMNII